jgi:hypothetical protein
LNHDNSLRYKHHQEVSCGIRRYDIAIKRAGGR